MSSSKVHSVKKFLIPLEEINRATQNFNSRIGFDQYGEVYKGQLSARWQNRLATITHNNERNDCHELEIISIFHHENIIAFIGYCDDDNGRIMVHEYATNGRLDKYLIEEEKRYYLTWAQRLRICIGAAKGLNYLHLGIGEHGRVIHRDFKSENILLDENLEAKICGFGLSELVRGYLPHPLVYKPAPFGKSYRDPIYKETSILNTESDVYSYGIVMFEILIGMLANQERAIGESYRKQKLINMVRRCYDDGLEKLIDPSLRDHIDRRSFLLFTNIAYKCISFNIKDRPTMDEIVKRIEEALNIHNQQAASAIAKRRLESKRRFLIPLGDIKKATKNFSEETLIWAGYNMVYKGQFFDRWHNFTTAIKRYPRNDLEAKHMFHNELMLISSFHHENIVPFIGYCDESNEMIIVSEYAINGSLNNHLKDPNKRRCITWAQRLNICIGVARGLKYLHSGLGEHERVIHGDIKSGQILLSQNLEAKICGFGESFLVPRNHPDTQVCEGTVGHQYYIDPIYSESGIPKTEMDVYSFGVVLFEILTGMLANQRKSIGDNEPLDLINLVRRYFDDGLDMLIDPHIMDEIDARALHTFTRIAYKCISFIIKDCPSMNKIIKRMEEALYIQNHGAASTVTRIDQKIADFLIPLIDINSAIGEKGQETRIGDGGFGVVYKGQPSERWQNRTVAIKCLHPESYQGEHEFRNELKMIFNFNHENIIPFIGYCDEGEEKIIVFEYASNGSLDCHLEDKVKRHCLTWERRLKICLGAARGLDYLHSGLGEDNRVIHRDVKSGNILLDDNMEAKICDFGLSKSGPINKPHTKVYTNAAGTNFYMDPIYHESGILQKESDVYSFGVVMFELLSGMLAYNRRSFGDGTKPQTLIKLVRRYYDYKPEWLIDPVIRDEIDSRSFNTFKEVAFQCISFNPKERPTMETIMDRIEEALEFQVMKKNLSSYLKRAGELIDMADQLLVKGLEDNPDDHGFMELKELRDQLFVPRKYSHNPEDNEDPTEEAYEKCFTPEKGVNKKDSGASDEYVFPFTQVYGTPTEVIAVSDEVCREWERNHQQISTRLDFEDDAEFDLNLTQPPVTQGKVVVDDLAEDQVLLDSLRDYVSQETADGGGFKTPDHPISVRAHESNTSNRLSRFGRESMANKSKEIVHVYPDPVPLNLFVPKLEHARAKHQRLLPEVLMSPYMTREVSVLDGIAKHEQKVAECIFSARFKETDIVFKTRFVDGERVVLESLFPGIDIASGAIDLFTHVLNNAEKHRSKMTVTRIFCHTAMLTSDMESWEYEKLFEKFVENMDNVVNISEYKTLEGVQLVFFPVIQGRHFFVVCMNMKDGEVQILDNLLLPDKTGDERFTWFIMQLISVFEDYLLHKNNPNYDRMTRADRKVLHLGCRTTNNFVDCGVFTMRHMETYKGDGADLCCLSKEGKKQFKELRDLRIKYVAKILLSDCNLVKSDIDKEVHAFRTVLVEEKKRLQRAAFETIKLRVSTKFEVK